MSKCSVVVWTRADIRRAAQNLGISDLALVDEVFEAVDDNVVAFQLKAPMR